MTEAEDRVSKSASKSVAKSENRLVRYFKETRAELRKVTWPTRRQATNLSLIVLGVTIAMAIFLGAVDLLFSTLVQLLIS
jgi:preprotein translocase subunit SecE